MKFQSLLDPKMDVKEYDGGWLINDLHYLAVPITEDDIEKMKMALEGRLEDNDVERKKDFTGLNGETCWILVTDHFTRAVFGDTRVSKASPIEWLRSFLHQYSPQCQGKYVYLDQGGELYANPAVRTLFAQFGYAIRPTGADASNQNGPVERAHLTVANALRAMLLGAGLDPRFWPMPSIISSVSLMPLLPVTKSSPLLRSFMVRKRISLASALLVAVCGSAPLVVAVLSSYRTHAKVFSLVFSRIRLRISSGMMLTLAR
ncbi:hypothetical protein IV203_003197 [Nitzschia inconspicua]|uniref:Integrase catalytic domain-containing protein n=1 Tax=Nitzschia inconspicua TaxID=303405 RepID=A0A9K3L1U4_9STRA|nr:hypothetical protein IV203_003197 [Nitzschia inconspicua]